MRAATETAVRFGPGERLVGILDHRPGDAPVCALLMNVGVTQRIGPRRLNVKLARALAAHGIPSFRFDLSGIGDSGAAEAGSDYRTQAVADLRAAMDHVQQATGIERYAILGICSGAVNGYRAAQADPRVTALMMFDGYAFPTVRTRLLHDLTRLRTTSVGEAIGKAAKRLRRAVGLDTSPARVSIFYAAADAQSPGRAAYGDVLDALAARGVRLLVAYSGSLLGEHNHAAQFRRVFAGRAFLAHTVDRYLPHIDHIATPLAAQRELASITVDWMRRDVLGTAAATSLVFDEPRRDAAAA